MWVNKPRHPAYHGGARQIEVQHHGRILAVHQALQRFGFGRSDFLLNAEFVESVPQYLERLRIPAHQQSTEWHTHAA